MEEQLGKCTVVNGYTVFSEAYQVPGAERWEYLLLLEKDGQLIEEWDSNVETYNGLQAFTREEAIQHGIDAVNEIEQGDRDYFAFKDF
jgi:hypothetical protein